MKNKWKILKNYKRIYSSQQLSITAEKCRSILKLYELIAHFRSGDLKLQLRKEKYNEKVYKRYIYIRRIDSMEIIVSVQSVCASASVRVWQCVCLSS